MEQTKVNFYELVAEANVARVVEEEEQLTKADQSIRDLKQKTNEKLHLMAELRELGDEEARREVRNEVVVDNMRLVTQVLKKYGYFNSDKFQNGCVGLLKAAETFKVAEGTPFPNYAAFCIETEIRFAFKRQSRSFESKHKGFLESIDEPSAMSNGDTASKHDMIADPYAEGEIDAMLQEAEIDDMFYNIIIPAIESYGTRSMDIDMDHWQQLEIQYILELSVEDSQRSRLTFTRMAEELGSTPQNMRTRHKRVMQLIRQRCEEAGYTVAYSANGRARFYNRLEDEEYSYSRRYRR